MQRKAITVYHVHFFDNKMLKQDYYFGSISAIFEVFTIKQIGIQASSLYNFRLNEIKNPIYQNNICRIRKDIVISKAQTK